MQYILKNGKSPGVDNIPAEILKHEGSGIIDVVLTVVCLKIWAQVTAYSSWQHTTLSELQHDQHDLSPK